MRDPLLIRCPGIIGQIDKRIHGDFRIRIIQSFEGDFSEHSIMRIIPNILKKRVIAGCLTGSPCLNRSFDQGPGRGWIKLDEVCERCCLWAQGLDTFTRECLALETETSFGTQRVTRVLDEVIARRGAPKALRMDNGPQLTSRHFLAWCVERKMTTNYIQPGKPVQNGHVESFHGWLRDECLNVNWFRNLLEAQRKITLWRHDYNTARPHSSLAYRTPDEGLTGRKLSGNFTRVVGPTSGGRSLFLCFLADDRPGAPSVEMRQQRGKAIPR